MTRTTEPKTEIPADSAMSAQPIRIEHRGQQWAAMYEVEGGEVHVWGAYGSGRLKIGRRKPLAVAAEVLFGLVDDWCRVTRGPVSPRRLAQRPSGVFHLR